MIVSNSPTASVLVYLFGDLIVGPAHGPLAKLPGSTYTTPCSGTNIFTNEMVEHALAIALWSLQEQGFIQLEEHTRSVLGIFKSKGVRVVVRRADDVHGIEGELLRFAAAQANQDVERVIYRWFGHTSASPWHEVMVKLEQACVSLGYFDLVDAHRHRLAGQLLGDQKAEPNCERIGEVRAKFEALRERWNAFQTAEPSLVTALLSACRTGLHARVENTPASTAS